MSDFCSSAVAKIARACRSCLARRFLGWDCSPGALLCFVEPIQEVESFLPDPDVETGLNVRRDAIPVKLALSRDGFD